MTQLQQTSVKPHGTLDCWSYSGLLGDSRRLGRVLSSVIAPVAVPYGPDIRRHSSLRSACRACSPAPSIGLTHTLPGGLLGRLDSGLTCDSVTPNTAMVPAAGVWSRSQIPALLVLPDDPAVS